MTPARDPKQVFAVIEKKVFGRKHLAGDIWAETFEEASRGAIWEETSEERHLGRAIQDDSGKTWDHFGSIWDALGSPEIIGGHLEASGIIQDRLKSSR